jgi:hypothetical protein
MYLKRNRKYPYLIYISIYFYRIWNRIFLFYILKLNTMKNISFFIPYIWAFLYSWYSIIFEENSFFFLWRLVVFVILWILIYWKLIKSYWEENVQYYTNAPILFIISNITLISILLFTWETINNYIMEYSALIWIGAFLIKNLFIFSMYAISELILVGTNTLIIKHFQNQKSK